MCPIAGTRCKACTSPNREFIDEQLRGGATAPSIVTELNRRGEPGFMDMNLYNHRKHHLGKSPVEVDALLQRTIQEYEERARYAPVEELPLLHIVIQGLKQLQHSKTSPETIIKAMDAITRQREAKTQQALLMAWAERAFPTSQATAPLEATSVRQLEASSSP